MPTLNTSKHATKRNNLFLRAAKGHFASSNRHSNYYIDVVAQKSRLSEAKAVAEELMSYFFTSTIVDTILCLDGTEVIGACLAQQLTGASFVSMNAHKSIYVVTPETVNTNQLLFRENIIPMINSKHVMILAVSYSSGKTVESAIEAVRYYGGYVSGVSAIFSTAEKTQSDLPIYSCFNPDFIGDYKTYPTYDCPMCKAGQKIDALINSFGFSTIS